MYRLDKFSSKFVASLEREHRGVLGYCEASALDVFPGKIKNKNISFSCVSSHSLAKMVRFFPHYAVVARPCDLKALESLPRNYRGNPGLLVSLDCIGTLSPNKIGKIAKAKGTEIDDLVSVTLEPENLVLLTNTREVKAPITPHLLRPSCRRCKLIGSDLGDVSIGLYDGSVLTRGITEKGRRFLKESGLRMATPQEENMRMRILNRVAEERRALRKEEFQGLKLKLTAEGGDYWRRQFNKCIKCYGCIDACPLCVCPHCAVEDQYSIRGRIPADMFNFHLPWISHILQNCVNCGQCDDSCPADIPLSTLIQYLQDRLDRILREEVGA